MGILKDLFLIALIISGLTIRLLLSNLPGFHIDINDWFAWAIRLSHFNFSQFYSKEVFTDYTPGYLYILSLLGFLKNLSGLENGLFYILLKIPAIVSEVFISLFVYYEVRRSNSQKAALAASSFILFNPALIFNSSIWGQIDSVLSAVLLGSIYLLKQKRLILSSIVFSVAFLIKPQAIALAPIFFLFFIKKPFLRSLVKLTLPGLITIFILSFPFFPGNPLYSLLQKILQTANEYPYISLNAYNFWGVVGFWLSDKTFWNGFTYQSWGSVLFALYWLILAYLYVRKKLSIYSVATLAALAFFFLPTRVHERYIYPALIFLIISMFQLKSKLLIGLATTLSFLHLANLYYVYIYYNKFYFNSSDTLYIQSIYGFLANQPKLLSLLSTTIFIIVSIIIIKQGYGSQKNFN